MIFRTIYWQQYYCDLSTVERVSDGSLTVAAVAKRRGLVLGTALREFLLSVANVERGELANGSVVLVIILLSYADSSNWREWLHRAMRRGRANAARTRAGCVSPWHEGRARRRGGDSGRP